MQEDPGRLTDASNPLVEIINDIIPVLNGRDDRNNVAYLGPKKTIVHRYLVVLYVAKFVPTFTIWGESLGHPFFSPYIVSPMWQKHSSVQLILIELSLLRIFTEVQRKEA